MIVIYILVGAMLGAAVSWLLSSRKASAKEAEKVQLTIEMEKKNTELQLRGEQIGQMTTRIGELEKENKQLTGTSQSQEREIELLKRQAADEARIRNEQFSEQLKTAKEQLTNVAHQILEQNTAKLKEQNTESIGNITQPLKDAISDMKKALADNMKDAAEHSAW
ncbi:MAG: hypothetical protein ACI4TW_08165, partial [Prevotella sp.]